MANVISDKTSGIEHMIIEDQLKHVLKREIVILNDNRVLDKSSSGFILLDSGTRKVRRGEFDGYYEGRVYIYNYIKVLD